MLVCAFREADSDGDGNLDLLDFLCLYARGKRMGLAREAQLLQHYVLYRLMVPPGSHRGFIRYDDALMYLCQVKVELISA